MNTLLPIAQPAPAPRRDFLLKAASLLGVSVSAGMGITLIEACQPTTPDTTGGTGGNTGGNTGTGGSTGGSAGASGNTVNISMHSSLQNVGGGVVLEVMSNRVVIIRASASDFLVLTAICTHEGCVVNPPHNGVISCDCHGSSFSATDGRVLNGPATAALRRYTSSFNTMTNTLTIMF